MYDALREHVCQERTQQIAFEGQITDQVSLLLPPVLLSSLSIS